MINGSVAFSLVPVTTEYTYKSIITFGKTVYTHISLYSLLRRRISIWMSMTLTNNDHCDQPNQKSSRTELSYSLIFFLPTGVGFSYLTLSADILSITPRMVWAFCRDIRPLYTNATWHSCILDYVIWVSVYPLIAIFCPVCRLSLFSTHFNQTYCRRHAVVAGTVRRPKLVQAGWGTFRRWTFCRRDASSTGRFADGMSRRRLHFSIKWITNVQKCPSVKIID